jgi:subtilisin-like proprotein convertase family protein
MSPKRLPLLLAGMSLLFSVASLLPIGDGTPVDAQAGNQTMVAPCSNPNLPIPEFDPNDPTSASDTISVPDGGRICDLDVYINASHTYVGDLSFDLQHTGGAGPVTLMNQPNCDKPNIDVTVNDEGTDGNVQDACDTPPPAIAGNRVGGSPPSMTLLTAFDGDDLAGDWTLTVTDNEAQDTGTLHQWCLIPQFCPPRDLNHFLCYETHHGPIDLENVSLEDQFGLVEDVRLRKPKRLCNPANKNDENMMAPDAEDHLVGYPVRHPERFERRKVTVTNQFDEVTPGGEGITVELIRPELLLVPSVKDEDQPVIPPFPVPGIDHFQCYRVKGGRTRANVSVTDQFGTFDVAVKQPFRLCAPVDKNGEGVSDENGPHLMCYKVRVTSGPKPPELVWVGNQFGPDELDVRHVRELCVPSTKIVPGEPTPTVTATATVTPTATPTPTPTATQSPGCGFLFEEGGGERYGPPVGGICGGPCPTDQQCVFNQGDCRCTPVSEVCHFIPPQTGNQQGMCMGLCPQFGAVCVPVIGAAPCACVLPGGTATPTPTATATPTLTQTMTPEPTETMTPEPTETMTPEPTETMTPGADGDDDPGADGDDDTGA